jgi:glycerol uptake facilitator-like aquaporin
MEIGTTLSTTLARGLIIKTVLTTELVLMAVIFTTHKSKGPIVMGLTLLTIMLAAAGSTGGSFNPARSFGPAVIMWTWENHWQTECSIPSGHSFSGIRELVLLIVEA